MFQELIQFVRDTYQTKAFIPLHAPQFVGNEKAFVSDTIDSTFVSSVGKYVDQFESDIESFTSAPKAVATVNGTAALHTALHMSGVVANDLVITQALTFVATCNAITQLGAESVFIDVSKESMGLCPVALESYLESEAFINDEGLCQHRSSSKIIRAVVPMHTFGHPVQLDELKSICERWHLVMIEDAAESLGSYYKGIHTGNHGRFSVLSFNGNKIITTGGGGMVLCQSELDAKATKHITTTAKVPHAYEFYHDEAGFNYRMPNLNAALGCAQLQSLPSFLEQKRALAEHYDAFFSGHSATFVKEPSYAKSNYWLNAILCNDKTQRDQLLKETNEAGVMTRPIWQLMHRLPMHQHCYRDELNNAIELESLIVNLPSSAIEISRGCHA